MLPLRRHMAIRFGALVWLILLSLAVVANAADGQSRPNVILIMADDKYEYLMEDV